MLQPTNRRPFNAAGAAKEPSSLDTLPLVDLNSTGVVKNQDLSAEAQGLVDLMGCPEQLETMTLAQVTQQLQRCGYQEEDAGAVTLGWGRKLGAEYTYAFTGAIFATNDSPRQVVALNIGSSGAYSICLLAKNLDQPSAEELVSINAYLSVRVFKPTATINALLER